MVRENGARSFGDVVSLGEDCARRVGGGCPILSRFGDRISDCLMEQMAVLANLSPRERQVHLLLVKGRTNKMIAAELGISQRTVEFHRANIMNKLGAKSLADLIEKTRGRLASVKP
ncbi:MAG: LuxR C-terminal-related transcriptional regulator [Magnetospirillum sp. WYHS-4]